MNSREQFEQAFPVPSNIRWSEEYQSYGYIVRNSPNLTQVHRYRSMWNAWQASRQALTVSLPSQIESKYMEYYPDVEGGCFNDRAYLFDLEAAIEAAGLRVKP